MNIYRKRRQRPAVPIITLIDILAILLIFFIVTTTFKEEQSLIQINVPKASEFDAGSADPVKRVPLGISAQGEVTLGDNLLSLDTLSESLKKFREENPDLALELKVDEKAPVGMMVKVWDAAKKANIEIKDLPLRILLEK